MCPTSDLQHRLNEERKESKAKPDGSIQKAGTKHAGFDVEQNAKEEERKVSADTARGVHKGEPVKNPKVQLPGG